jgi:hypothetical protein
MSNESITVSVSYFAKPGKENTVETLRLAKKRADELGIKTIVIASTWGDSAAQLAQLCNKSIKIVAVGRHSGYTEPNVVEVKPENRQVIESLGGIIFNGIHAFGGVGRSVRIQMNTYQIEEIIAETLKTFGQGMKVACEISLMAADAGLVKTGEEVISIGGSGKGSDTAIVLQTFNARDFFKIRIKEIICKPRL